MTAAVLLAALSLPATPPASRLAGTVWAGVAADPERSLAWVDGRRVAQAALSRSVTVPLGDDLGGGPHRVRVETHDRAGGRVRVGSAAEWAFARPGRAAATYPVPDPVPRPPGPLPHYAADGSGVRTAFDPALSRPILALYQLDGSEVPADTAGFNAVTAGWLAAADLYGGGLTADAYLAAWGGWFRERLDRVPPGWLWLAASDDLVGDGGRTRRQADFYTQGKGVAPWGPAYLTAALARLKATGKVPVVLVGDELGDTGRYPDVPAAGSPGLKDIAAAIRSAGLPQTWQVAVHATSGPEFVRTYGQPPYGDGGMVAWTVTADRPLNGQTLCHGVYDARVSLRRALAMTAPGRPRLAQVGATGPFFRAAPGYAGVYRPGVDVTVSGGWAPPVVLAQCGVAIVGGCCGWRVYEFDHAAGRANRARPYTPDDPTPDRSVGAGPDGTPATWAVLGHANRWFAARFERLCQPPADPPAFGSDWEAGAWGADPGRRLVLAVNGTDSPRPLPLAPPGPWTGGGTLTVSGSTVTQTGTAPTAGQVIPPGGWAWWEG